MLLLIDNYDSFTYNLVHFLVDLGARCVVHRNDQITVDEAMALKPAGIVLSPGPCTPNEAGICMDLIKAAAKAQIEARGYSGVKSLTRDTAGNWAAKAMRDNVEVAVILEPSGNIREQ